MKAALLMIVLAAPAAAQEVDCADAQTQIEMTFCAEKDWQSADAALNAAYKGAIARMKALDADLPETLKGGEDALRRAQRAWVAFRDAACETEGYEMRGGTGEAMMIYACRARLTDQRTRDLRVLLNEG